jgi:type III restriction enzyme
VMASPVVPARPREKKAAERLVGEFVKGLGIDAPSTLSRFLGTAGARLVRLVTREHKKFLSKPTFDEVVALTDFDPTRQGRAVVTDARKGKFTKNVGYTGWSKRAMFDQAWFDSKTERTAANLLDESSDVKTWARLHNNDIPILWHSGGSWYNPDLLAIDKDGIHWIIEVKSNKDLESEDVQAKREAAQRWANHVNADQQVEAEWRYLLASEDDVDGAKDWTALKSLATI